MRIPKFRAWDKELKQMKPVRIINFEAEGICFIHNNQGYDRYFKDDSFELMQSTGLVDKNGIEIFEGDVVKTNYENKIGRVFFSEDDLQWQIGIQYDWVCYNKQSFEECEVIGNIFENEDLLESEV